MMGKPAKIGARINFWLVQYSTRWGRQLFENLVLNLNFKLIEPLFVSVLNGLSL
jgi:hypothetical protein